MDRRIFIAGTLSLLAAPLDAEAQPAGQVYRIGFLSGTTASVAGPLRRFRQGLRDLGYEEGKNILIESRWADGHDERLLALAEELVRLRPDVLVTASTPATAAAQQATTTIPIVMGSVDNPVREGFVKSLARPGGNTTGVALLGSDLAPKRLQLLKEIIPTLRRVAVLLNTRNPASREDLRQTEAAARRLDVTVRVFEVREPAEFETAFTAIARERPDGLIVVTDPLTASHMAHIVEFAARNRLPAMYTVNAFVLNLGGLISYGTESSETWRRAAWYVNRILKGAEPADLPIEQPTKFELVVNMKTAKALGLTIPPAVLVRADEDHRMTQCRHLLLTAPSCALRDRPAPGAHHAVTAVREWLSSWRGIGFIAADMARQGYDLQLTRYAEEGWRILEAWSSDSAGGGDHRCSDRTASSPDAPGQRCGWSDSREGSKC